MESTFGRTIWAALALSPALAVVLLPDWMFDSALASLGGTGLLLLAWLVAFGAAHCARRAIRVVTRHTGHLLRRPARHRPPVTPPAPEIIRDDLHSILASAPPGHSRIGGPEPETRDFALGRVLDRTLKSWDRTTLDALSDEELRELWIFAQLVRSKPDRAGELAQTFLNPDVVLDIRDGLAEIGRRRDDYDRRLKAYDATIHAWTTPAPSEAKAPLMIALQNLPHPDPDLWHHVIRAHDPRSAPQARAALWCARQPACDRASVAHFLAYVAADGRLEAAALRSDTAWLDGVRDVIDGWNAGRYSRRSIGLEPADEVATAAPLLQSALTRLAEITGTPVWDMPRGLFAEYHGAPAAPRDSWDLATGRLRHAPDIADYIHIAADHAA